MSEGRCCFFSLGTVPSVVPSGDHCNLQFPAKDPNIVGDVGDGCVKSLVIIILSGDRTYRTSAGFCTIRY